MQSLSTPQEQQQRVKEFQGEQAFGDLRFKSTLNGLVDRCMQAERESGRLGVENTALRKANEELRLGSDRMKKVLKLGQGRAAAMARAFQTACPNISTEDAHRLAQAIDSFEAFKTPSQLRAEVRGAPAVLWIWIWWGNDANRQWHTRYPCNHLSENEAHTLFQVVGREIDQQKQFFGARQQLLEVCVEHLAALPLAEGPQLTVPDLAVFLEGPLEEKHARVRQLQKKLTDRFECLFRDLVKHGWDVDSVLLDSWQPLVFRRATWAYSYLKGIQLAGSTSSLTDKDLKQAAVDDAKEDMMTLWNLAQTLPGLGQATG